MHILKHIAGALTAAAALALAGCVAEPEMPGSPKAQTVDVPLTISLGAAWEVDVADGPQLKPPSDHTPTPGGGNTTNNNWVNGDADVADVDRVKIVTFRRSTHEGEQGANTDPYIIDPQNCKILTAAPQTSTDIASVGEHIHKVASGTIKKTYGFEYRIIAVAYASNRQFTPCPAWDLGADESAWMTFTGDDIDSYAVTFASREITAGNSGNWTEYLRGSGSTTVTHNTHALNRMCAHVPQVFYGEVRQAGSASNVIPFADENLDAALPLEGILYRAVAKVDLVIANVGTFNGKATGTERDKNPLWLAMIADNVFTSAKLSNYDAFLSPTLPVAKPDPSYGDFTCVAYSQASASDTNLHLTAYFLPCMTRLGLRICLQLPAIESGIPSYAIHSVKMLGVDESGATTGTGILQPSVVGDQFVLRRNHRYTLSLDQLSTLQGSEHLID